MPPGRSPIVTVPLCAVTISRTIARPSPAPPALRDRFAAAEIFGFAVVGLLVIWLTYLGFGAIAEQHDPARLLAGTPLEIEADRHPARTPLSLAEQVDMVAVMVVSQGIQVVFFTTGLFAYFLALGFIAIPDVVTVLWSAEETCPVGEPPCAGTWFGFTFRYRRRWCTRRCSSRCSRGCISR